MRADQDARSEQRWQADQLAGLYIRENERHAAEAEALANHREEAAELRAEQQRDDLANAWKLQAAEKANRAHELYKAELYDEAYALITDAIRLDPGSMRAYELMSKILKSLGKHEEALTCDTKQVKLLRTESYSHDKSAFLRLLGELESQKQVDELLSILHQNSTDWKFDNGLLELMRKINKLGRIYDLERLSAVAVDTVFRAYGMQFLDHSLELIAEFKKLGLVAEEERLLTLTVEKFLSISKGLTKLGANVLRLLDEVSSLGPPSLASHLAEGMVDIVLRSGDLKSGLVDQMINRRLYDEAERLVRGMMKKSPSLWLHTDLIEVQFHRSSKTHIPVDELSAYLRTISSDRRSSVLAEFRALEVKNPCPVCAEVLVAIRHQLASRYAEWRLDVVRIFSEQAEREASTASNRQRVKSFLIAALAGFFGMCLLPGLVSSLENENLTGAIMFLGTVIPSSLIYFIIQNRIRQVALKEGMSKLPEIEPEWVKILSGT